MHPLSAMTMAVVGRSNRYAPNLANKGAPAMRDRGQYVSLSFGFLLCFYLMSFSNAIPMQITLNQRATECFFEKLEVGEMATVSLFILSGAELRAAMTFDGPLPEEEPIRSGLQLLTASQKVDQGLFGRHGDDVIRERSDVDFEHLNIGEDTYNEEDDSIEEEIPENESIEERRARRARQRTKALEQRQRRDQRRIEQRERVQEEGEPHQVTFRAKAAGWYRYCVVGTTWHQINVEVDLRKLSEMGSFGPDGHVITYIAKAVLDEESYMEEDTADSEGIKDEDFQSTRAKLKTLRRLIADIQSKQSQERHRLIVHAATNEHSHARMVISSLVQTLLFMAVTGFQVYTIRKWFKGAPVLGR